jgi:hypothetical protein
MRQDFAPPAREQVPPITRPDSLGVKALDQLPNDRLNAPAFLHQPKRPSSFSLLWPNDTAQAVAALA